MLTIYRRFRAVKESGKWVESESGGWRFVKVQTGRGIKTGDLQPPFYVRKPDKTWHNLGASNYAEACAAAIAFETGKVAAAHGQTVVEYENALNKDRVTLTKAVEQFFTDRETELRPRTETAYRNDLKEFRENVGVRFMDELTADAMKKYYQAIRKKHSKRTVRNHVINTHTFLKALKVPETVRVDMKAVAKPERAKVEPYSDEQVTAILQAMTEELRVVFRFFLGTGCREQEVQFAAWTDLNLDAKTFTVHAKPDFGFFPKNHTERTVYLPSGLVRDLKAWKEKASASRWIFPSKHGLPDGHLLRKLKKVAFRAGLNCGHCVNRAGESCKQHDVCSQFKLHKFRKTCATRWAESDIPLNDIREYLGHGDLGTTQKYLGLSPQHKVGKKIDTAFGD